MKKLIADFLAGTNGKKRAQLLLMLLLGVLLMLFGSFYTEKKTSAILPDIEHEQTENIDSGLLSLEKRLTEALGCVDGVGNVKVMITLKSGPLSELATDTVSEKSDQRERTETRHVIVSGKNGINEPVAVKQTQPQIEGVIIVAEGGNKAEVKSRLTKAAGALLNLPAHKIEVLKMKEEL